MKTPNTTHVQYSVAPSRAPLKPKEERNNCLETSGLFLLSGISFVDRATPNQSHNRQLFRKTKSIAFLPGVCVCVSLHVLCQLMLDLQRFFSSPSFHESRSQKTRCFQYGSFNALSACAAFTAASCGGKQWNYHVELRVATSPLPDVFRDMSPAKRLSRSLL